MKVYKFGGASVKNADGVRNLRNIVDGETNLFVIVSAMGKTTNALERIFDAMRTSDNYARTSELEQLRTYHNQIIENLFEQSSFRIDRVEEFFDELARVTRDGDFASRSAEAWYDQIVAYGELISTAIVSAYLNHTGIANDWIDMRQCFRTQLCHKDANVNLEASTLRLNAELEKSAKSIFVGQGFIGSAPDGSTTTLGREGSDYSAAVVANITNAESMSVWKDVDGILNADPKIFSDATKIDSLNYVDTIELAYSGAQIIHPKTIKPLQNKNIPLYVRPFSDKTKSGTVINGTAGDCHIPIIILKRNQTVLQLRSKDLSFVLEEKFAIIFSILDRYRVKTNLIHNTAVDLSLVFDNSWHIDEICTALENEGFDVTVYKDMELLTIRKYSGELFDRYVKHSKNLICQTTETTVRSVRARQL